MTYLVPSKTKPEQVGLLLHLKDKKADLPSACERVWVGYAYVAYLHIPPTASPWDVKVREWVNDSGLFGGPPEPIPTNMGDHWDFSGFVAQPFRTMEKNYIDFRYSLAIGIAERVKGTNKYKRELDATYLISQDIFYNAQTVITVVDNKAYGGGWNALKKDNLWIKLVGGEPAD